MFQEMRGIESNLKTSTPWVKGNYIGMYDVLQPVLINSYFKLPQGQH